jgi:hypothetical protein
MSNLWTQSYSQRQNEKLLEQADDRKQQLHQAHFDPDPKAKEKAQEELDLALRDWYSREVQTSQNFLFGLRMAYTYDRPELLASFKLIFDCDEGKAVLLELISEGFGEAISKAIR